MASASPKPGAMDRHPRSRGRRIAGRRPPTTAFRNRRRAAASLSNELADRGVSGTGCWWRTGAGRYRGAASLAHATLRCPACPVWPPTPAGPSRGGGCPPRRGWRTLVRGRKAQREREEFAEASGEYRDRSVERVARRRGIGRQRGRLRARGKPGPQAACSAEKELGGARLDAAIAKILDGLFELWRDGDPVEALGAGERRLALLQKLHGLGARGSRPAARRAGLRGDEPVARDQAGAPGRPAGDGDPQEGAGGTPPRRGAHPALHGAGAPDAGREEDAEPFFRRALDVLETAFGPDHLEVAEALEGWRSAAIRSGSRIAPSASTAGRSRRTCTPWADSPPAAEVAQYLAELFMDDGEFELAAPRSAGPPPPWKRSAAPAAWPWPCAFNDSPIDAG